MNLTCYEYQLPFKKPLTTSSRSYKNRRGWILCCEEAGSQYFGEAAPLPGFSTERMQEVQQFIHQHIDTWTQLLKKQKPILQLSKHYKEEKLTPALQFALDTLAYQLEAQRAQTTITNLLFDGSRRRFITVNGLISLVDKENALHNVQTLVTEGFRTIKCKVGQHFQQELENLLQIRTMFPELNIRLDANCAWEFAEAAEHLDALKSLDIQYCEEPLRNPTAEHLRSLNQKIPIPLALDETLNTSDRWPALLSHISVLVIKPMLIGSFNNLLDIKHKADESNCALVFTSSLESSIGRGMTALLASGMGTENYAHGLNTGNRLTRDTVPHRPLIQQGSIYIDKQTLPLKADKAHLENISISSITSS